MANKIKTDRPFSTRRPERSAIFNRVTRRITLSLPEDLKDHTFSVRRPVDHLLAFRWLDRSPILSRKTRRINYSLLEDLRITYYLSQDQTDQHSPAEDQMDHSFSVRRPDDYLLPFRRADGSPILCHKNRRVTLCQPEDQTDCQFSARRPQGQLLPARRPDGLPWELPVTCQKTRSSCNQQKWTCQKVNLPVSWDYRGK